MCACVLADVFNKAQLLFNVKEKKVRTENLHYELLRIKMWNVSFGRSHKNIDHIEQRSVKNEFNYASVTAY